MLRATRTVPARQTRERSFRPIDEHHVLGPILRGEETFDVTLRRLGRARDGAEACSPVLARDQALRGRADERDPAGARGGRGTGMADAAERAVQVERGRGGRSLGLLRRHALEHVAGHDVALDLPHHLLVPPAVGMAHEAARGAASRDATGSRPEPLPRPPPRRPRAPRPCRRRDRSARGSPRRRAGCRGNHARRPGARPSGFEDGDVVAGQVADDRQPERFRLLERHELRAGPHPRAPAQTSSLDRPARSWRSPSRAAGGMRRGAERSVVIVAVSVIALGTKETSVGGLEAKRVGAPR